MMIGLAQSLSSTAVVIAAETPLYTERGWYDSPPAQVQGYQRKEPTEVAAVAPKSKKGPNTERGFSMVWGAS